MIVIVNFCGMAGMVMIVWGMTPGVFMIVRLWGADVSMLVAVLVEVIMCMGVRMLAAVLHITV